MSSITHLQISDMGGIKIPAPSWINLPIDEQIQHQVKSALCESSEPRAIMVFTYDKDRQPQMQRQIIEI